MAPDLAGVASPGTVQPWGDAMRLLKMLLILCVCAASNSRPPVNVTCPKTRCRLSGGSGKIDCDDIDPALPRATRELIGSQFAGLAAKRMLDAVASVLSRQLKGATDKDDDGGRGRDPSERPHRAIARITFSHAIGHVFVGLQWSHEVAQQNLSILAKCGLREG
jgi:hypothetical protein